MRSGHWHQMRALSRGGLNPADRSGPRFAFEDPRDAMAMLAGPHRSGKLALVLDA